MAVQATQIINAVRLLSGVPNQNQGRWIDSNILTFVDMAQKHLVQELLFPESVLTGPTIANQIYYTLPDTHRLLRVYLDGQPIVPIPGNIATLEGQQIGQYDSQPEAGAVTATGFPIPGGAGGVSQPQWTTVTPTAYPYIAQYGPPAPMTQPAFIGSMPRYFRDSGGIGIVPAPAGVVTLSIYGIFVPPDLTSTTQVLTVPSYYYDALVWYVVKMMAYGDSTQVSLDRRNTAEQEFQNHLRKLRTTVRQYKYDDAASLVRTDRWVYAFGRHVTGGIGDGNP